MKIIPVAFDSLGTAEPLFRKLFRVFGGKMFILRKNFKNLECGN
jgi:hypothetical protein